jgi:hypothetical protein
VFSLLKMLRLPCGDGTPESVKGGISPQLILRAVNYSAARRAPTSRSSL